MIKKSFGMPCNLEITALEVRVIDEKGEMLGILPTESALARVRTLNSNLDLVQVSDSSIPTCKIMNYGQLKYDRKKKLQQSKKKQKSTCTKEIKMKPHIDDNDFDVKIRKTMQFLEDGHKVKISVVFYGRNKMYKSKGKDLISRAHDFCKDLAKEISYDELQDAGNTVSLTFSPK